MRKTSGENTGRRVALCMNINDFYEHGIARGVVRYAREHPSWKLYGYGWMFRPVKDLLQWHGDGIISRVESTADEARMAARKLPVVDVAGAYTNNDFHQVNNDDFATGKIIGEHFLTRGFSSFAFAGVNDVTWSRKRKNGFLAAVKAAGVPAFEKPLTWWERQQAVGRLRSFLDKLPKPCGVFACNDTAGVKITSLCRAAGIDVPRSISVAGVDNEDVLCELSSPPLTSIPCDCERIGYRAAAVLDAMIRGRKTAKETLIPPGQLIIRNSSDIFHNADPIVADAMEFINARIGDGINVADVVEHFDISRRNLEMRFKAGTGMTLHDAIIRNRLETARRFLMRADIPIRDIAAGSGFGTLQQFYRKFTATYHMTPNEFRTAKLSKSATYPKNLKSMMMYPKCAIDEKLCK